MALERERSTYDKNREELLRQEGKYVVISGDEVAGVWATYRDALAAAYARFGLEPFMVKKIEAVEQVQFITRTVGFPCRT